MTLSTRIAPALARALEKKGYDALTEVQSAVLEDQAGEADLLVSAQTGSGKTVAFGLAIAPTLLEDEEAFGFAAAPLALVVAPTRELALQVQREFEWLFGEAYGRIASCVGGMDPRTERRALERGCHIVVGTPGRLRDHIERGALDMTALRAVVLDEADEMLDFGFREDLEFILDAAPAERRTLLFSATVPRAIADIARRFQRDAVRISTVSEREQHVDIEYRALTVAPRDREHAIINVLRYYDAERTIVFCRTREAVNHLSSRLGNRGFAVVALSGELSQTERTHALQAMRDGRVRVCVATDVAARGIDLPGLELVIHADLPTNAETLLHRSGRTGRAGRKGVCALIVPYNGRGRANRLLRDARVTADWAEAPGLAEIEEKDRERIFADPALAETHDEAVLDEARALVERYGAEQVAAAFLVRRRAQLPAAEELSDGPDDRSAQQAPRGERSNFIDGRWFILTAGRRQRAEPRWLLPLICRIGQVTKRDVGSIRIGDSESRFEISGESADRFMQSVEQAGGGEKSIRIRPVGPDDGEFQPFAGGDERPARAPRPPRGDRGDHAPRRERPARDRDDDARGRNTGAGATDAQGYPVRDTNERPVSPVRKRPDGDGKPFRKGAKSGGSSRPGSWDDAPGKPPKRKPAKAWAPGKDAPSDKTWSDDDAPRKTGKPAKSGKPGKPAHGSKPGKPGKPAHGGKPRPARPDGKPTPDGESYPRRRRKDDDAEARGATLKRVKRKPPRRDS